MKYTWDDITLAKYLHLHPIIHNEWSDIDKFKEIVYILTGKYEKVNEWSEQQIKDYEFLFNFDFKREIKENFTINGRFYRINKDSELMKAARYIEVKTFYQNDFITNIDKIIASMVVPQKRKLCLNIRKCKYIDLPYNSMEHSKYTSDMLDLPFIFAYNLGVYFLRIINMIDSKYPVLFDQVIEKEPNESGIEYIFNRYYGWIYSATQVAEHERITLDQAFELPVLQFLNDLAYLKMFKKLEAKQMEDIRLKK